MLQAYVGIVSRRGLELLYPEHPHTRQFLMRRVRRRPYHYAGIWSVIPSESAELVFGALESAHNRDALELMQSHAREYGLLIGDEPADATTIAEQ